MSKLTPTEIDQIRAIVESPAFSVMKKFAQIRIAMFQDLMVKEPDEKVIRQLQGRIIGIRDFIMSPQAFVLEAKKMTDREKSNNEKKKQKP